MIFQLSNGRIAVTFIILSVCNLPSNNVFAIGKNFTMSSFTTSSIKDNIDDDEYEGGDYDDGYKYDDDDLEYDSEYGGSYII